MKNEKRLRHELKFYINEFEYRVLRKKLQMVLQQDKNSQNDEGYLIRSLYFDSIYENDLVEKNYGIFKRKKYRIRIYNNSDRIIKLERKERYGEYICKESAPLTRHQYEQLLNWDYDFLKKHEYPLCRDFYHHIRSQHMSPKVIVDYIREAYIGDVSDVRITFDKHLRAGINSNDVFNQHLVTVEALTYPLLIMEVKYNQFLPKHIHQILKFDNHHRSAISKYVICREVGIQHNHSNM